MPLRLSDADKCIFCRTWWTHVLWNGIVSSSWAAAQMASAFPWKQADAFQRRINRVCCDGGAREAGSGQIWKHCCQGDHSRGRRQLQTVSWYPLGKSFQTWFAFLFFFPFFISLSAKRMPSLPRRKFSPFWMKGMWNYTMSRTLCLNSLIILTLESAMHKNRGAKISFLPH